MRVQQSLLASTFAASTIAASINYNAPAIVSTTLGSVEGLTLSTKVKAFLGIPFAVSPPERFSAPVDSKPWTETLKAKTVKPACVQQFGGKDILKARKYHKLLMAVLQVENLLETLRYLFSQPPCQKSLKTAYI